MVEYCVNICRLGVITVPNPSLPERITIIHMAINSKFRTLDMQAASGSAPTVGPPEYGVSEIMAACAHPYRRAVSVRGYVKNEF